MESLSERAVRSQIDRICDSDAFRAAPKLARLLRVLAEETLQGGETPLGQRFVAEQVMAEGDRQGPNASVAVRMQVGRLRRQLDWYYAAAGVDDPIRVEVPKRNYRLRFVPAGPAARAAAPRAVERATLAVVEFIDVRGGDLAWLPAALTRDVIVALAPFHGVAVRGPLPQTVLGRPSSAAADFLLVGDVRADRATAHVSFRLLQGDGGLQCWAKSVEVPLDEEGGLGADASAILAGVADELADETGVIACEGMRAAAAKPPESLSAHEVVLAFWRFLMTGGFDDLTIAREAAAASSGAPESAATLTANAMTRLAGYLSDPLPQARCPREAIDLVERAMSLAPGDPWVQVHRGFALWIAREPIGLEAICRTLEGRHGSGSFRGMVGSLMSVTGIDLDRGEALLAEAVARAPQPLYWYCHHLALCGFRRGDLAAMRAALGRIAVRTDPFSLVLRMVLAACDGDLATARGLSRAVLDVFPAFTDAGETMMRRLLHDDHVDAIAAALEPLGLGWFE